MILFLERKSTKKNFNAGLKLLLFLNFRPATGLYL